MAISIICATPPGFNPGMLLSELAADAFCRRNGLSGACRFHRILPYEDRLALRVPRDGDDFLQSVRRCDTGIAFGFLKAVAELDGDVPLYWGDFLHMRPYIREINRLLDQTGHGGGAEDLLLLAAVEDSTVARAVSFGTTLLFNSAGDLVDPAYAPALQRLATTMPLMLVRDGISAAQVAGFSGRGDHLGIDAVQMLALLDDWRDLFPAGTRHAETQAGLGLAFFARGRHDRAHPRPVIDELADVLKAEFRWIPWGEPAAFSFLPRQGDFGLPLLEGDARPRLEALVQAVAQAAVVVTDTYHLAVTAWSLGVPAIMMPGSYWPVDMDVNAGPRHARIDKRFVYFAQNGLLDFHLGEERLTDDDIRRAAVARILDLIESGIGAQHRARLRNLATSAEKRLLAALRGPTWPQPCQQVVASPVFSF